jgi:integrase
MDVLTKKCEQLSKMPGWMGKRDAAIIALPVMFGRRRGEVRQLKKGDIKPESGRIYVTFSVLKSHIPPKAICPNGHPCKLKWRVCPECGETVRNEDGTRPEGVKVGKANDEPTLATNQRLTTHPMAKFLLGWVKEVPEGGYLCAKSALPGIFPTPEAPLWDRPLSGSGITNVIEKHTEGLWPHLFRHNLATSFARADFDAYDLLQWFNWRRYDTAFHYVQLAGGERVKKMGESTA